MVFWMAIVLIFLRDGHGKVKNEKWLLLRLQRMGSGSRNDPHMDCSLLSQTNGMGLFLGDLSTVVE
jgi:hypothetical protein